MRKGTEFIKLFAAPAVYLAPWDDLKKRMNRITATWRSGCLNKMDDHLVHTTPNHHPTKMDVHPKTFLPIILAAKWFVRHSNTSPQPAATTFASSSMLIGNSICTLMSPEAATLSLFRIMLPLLVPSGRYNLGRRIKSCKV